MTVTDIQLLFDYYYWATTRILDATEKITPEQFVFNDARSESLRAILVHSLSSERIWRQRWQGKERGTDLAEHTFPTLSALRVYWRQQEQEMRDFLALCTEADLIRQVEGVTGGGTHYVDLLWHSMMQVLFHGAQHRSEAALMLTSCRSSPGDLDFFVFLRR
jgi:uncharacterized damage-inducible protein DinB